MSRTLLLFVVGVVAACLLYIRVEHTQLREGFPRTEGRGTTSTTDEVAGELLESNGQDGPIQAGFPVTPVPSVASSEVLANSDPTETASPESESRVDPTLDRQINEHLRMQGSVRKAWRSEEERDPTWAPAMERQLERVVREFLMDRPALFERYAVTSIACRTSVCRVQLSDYGTAKFLPEDPVLSLQEEVVEQPWATSFNNSGTHYMGSTEFGFLQYGFYFKVADSDDSQVQPGLVPLFKVGEGQDSGGSDEL